MLRVFVPKQSWLDRIVRGRAWIPVLGIMLVAIVALRVEVLKLTSGVGTQIQEASELQSSNATLRSSVSELSGNQRIEQLAESMGMVMPGPMDVHFVPVAAGTHLASAIKGIHTPESDTFLTSLVAEREADGTSVAQAVNTSAEGDLATPVSSGTTSDSGGTGTADSSGISAQTTDSTTDVAPTAAPDSTAVTTGAGAADVTTDGTSATDGGATSSSTAYGGTTDGSTTAGSTTDGSATYGSTDSSVTDSAAGTSSGTSSSTTTGGSTSGGSSLAG